MSNSKQLTPHENFIIDLKKFTAVTAVGVQALRRQGAGVISNIQKYLDTLDLSQTTSLRDQDAFISWLDEVTDALVEKYTVSWGAARKAISLFLRACFYNRYLYVEYGLDHLETWLEIPLDQVIAGQLRKEMRKKPGRGLLPSWNGLRELDKEDSEQFQQCASQMATDEKLSRVHLDVGLWVNNRK
jgi:hypothetical protein